MPCSSRICFLIFLATLLVATTKTNSVSDNNINLSTDKSSLASFKSYVTSYPQNILKNGWSDSKFVCNWTGVTCRGDPLRVVGLDLSFAGLVGTVPPHLGNLSSLVVLFLTNNSFHGLIPIELSHLKQLEIISFGLNDLTGEIPSWIGSLPKLRRLGLFGTQLSGSIQMAISNANLLETLDLYDNRLTAPFAALAGTKTGAAGPGQPAAGRVHPAPCSRHPAAGRVQPAGCTHPAPCCRHPAAGRPAQPAGQHSRMPCTDGSSSPAGCLAPGTRHPSPGRVLPAPCTRHPAPGRVQPTPSSRHPAPGRVLPAPCTRHPAPGRVQPAPSTPSRVRVQPKARSEANAGSGPWCQDGSGHRVMSGQSLGQMSCLYK